MKKTLEQDHTGPDTAPVTSGTMGLTPASSVTPPPQLLERRPLYPSVTTILGIKDKPALVGWAKHETTACAVRNLDVLTRIVQGGDRRPPSTG